MAITASQATVPAPHVTPVLLLVNDASMVAKGHAEIFIYLIGHKTLTPGEDIPVAKIVSSMSLSYHACVVNQ
jgi:phosphopantothenate synthetase